MVLKIALYLNMNEKDIARLMDLAKAKLKRAKAMTKKEAISSLHDAGILTKSGKLKQVYSELETAR